MNEKEKQQQEEEYTTIWFDEPSKIEKLKADTGHEYIWGGCYLNKSTNLVDNIYHKRFDKLYTVEYQPSPCPDYYNVILENEKGATQCIGMMKKDWTEYKETYHGGGFFLEGIKRSMEKVLIERQQQIANDENYYIWFGE